jgi:hypothetical protein
VEEEEMQMLFSISLASHKPQAGQEREHHRHASFFSPSSPPSITQNPFGGEDVEVENPSRWAYDLLFVPTVNLLYMHLASLCLFLFPGQVHVTVRTLPSIPQPHSLLFHLVCGWEGIENRRYFLLFQAVTVNAWRRKCPLHMNGA